MEQKNISKLKKPVYKKWWFWVIIAILIIGVGANMGAGEDNTQNNKPTISQSDNNSKKEESNESSYKTKATWADTSNYMFAVEIDNFDGDIFKSGTYKFYPDAVDLEDKSKTPVVWDIYVSTNLYSNKEDLKESELVAVVGGLEKDSAEIELKKGQYVYINYNSVLGEPTGMLQIEHYNQKDKDNENNNVIPTIKGSQAYDIILSIEEKTGIEKPETVHNEDSYLWNAVNSSYSYSIRSNKKHEVAYAQFMVLNGGDNAFLGFCASMPYDTAESQKAMDWVNQNVGQEANTTIGDAIFTLTNGNQGPVLTITAKGYDEYSLNKMANAE